MSDHLRPNILHLFTDQQRFDAIGAIGKFPFLKTPNLDRLMSMGTCFQRAYSPSPECVPARGAMITGCYPGTTGCYSNSFHTPTRDRGTFMKRLTEAGYRTHGIGKCDFIPDNYAMHGFESRECQEEVPGDRSRDDYARFLKKNGYEWVMEPHGVRSEMYYIPQVSPLPEAKHPTHWVGDRSIAFIEEQQESEQAWYLFSSFVHPHPPFAPPIPWNKLYRGPDMPMPDIPDHLEELLSFVNRTQNRHKYRDNGGLDLNLVRQIRAYYFACISLIDKQVGRILNALESTGQLENTLILFTADHGEYLGDYGCFGKRGMHDVSSRVPMLVRWPGGVDAGTSCSTPVSLVDLAPTFLEVAGADFSDNDFDGVSLQSILQGTCSRDRVYSQYNRGGDGLYMAVEADWKYIYSATNQREYLFDLKNDPKEHCNLVVRWPSHPQLSRLRDACLKWVRESGQPDALDDKRAYWKAYPVKQMPEDPDHWLVKQDPKWWDGDVSKILKVD